MFTQPVAAVGSAPRYNKWLREKSLSLLRLYFTPKDISPSVDSALSKQEVQPDDLPMVLSDLDYSMKEHLTEIEFDSPGQKPAFTASTESSTLLLGYSHQGRLHSRAQASRYGQRALGARAASLPPAARREPGGDAPERHSGKRGWGLNHFPGQPLPMLDNPFSELKFPNIQSKPPLAQLEAISSCPITCYLGEETDPHLSTTSFQAKQPQLPQPLLIRLVLQTLHQLRCPSLDTLQPLNVSLGVRGPKLNTAFEVRPHQCRVQGDHHFPSPAGHAIFDTSQDAIGFLGHLGTMLAHIQPAVNQHPQVLFCLAAFQPLFPKPVALHGVAVAQVQDLALGLVEPHTIDLSPSIQPVQVPLQSLPTLKQINTPTQLGVNCKRTEGALNPFLQIIDKDIKQNWPQHRALGNTACDRPPTGVNSIHHNSSGPAIQPVLNPVNSTPLQAMSSQFLQENAVGNRVKGFTEV
ncbi:hypothetical protein QYF61_023236 [Mycteria americana]|uniref:Uncharacterized protein n=1 Tax=Mycteria americana TaxID=33587 RepID=A0AAN7N4K2_MYCAM|nr:hypothetical protein QYF61_023236 [Mycteria americana]